MAFSNRIRLPFQILKPQFPEDKTVYRKADGTTKVLSVTVKKQYQGETDYLPEKWHQRLTIALAHDTVNIEGDKYLGGVSKNGDYTITWPDFLDYPTGKAAFAVDVTPFDASNSNCMTCEEASQLNLVDDTFVAALHQDITYTIQVNTNDNICCYPAVFSISNFNAAYIASASIDQTGLVTLHTKASFATQNGVDLLTYRVTCPNGAFDEADVFGNVIGTAAPVCLAPTALSMTLDNSTTANASWTAPATAPDHYKWQLAKASAPGIIVQSGDSAITFLVILGLDPSTDYIFSVRSQCDPTDSDSTASNYINSDFSTPNTTIICGQFQLVHEDPTRDSSSYISVSYLDCGGNNQTQIIPNHASRTVCALQASPGLPVSMFANPGIGESTGGFILFSYNYLGPCP
jgi:hypothetical protein